MATATVTSTRLGAAVSVDDHAKMVDFYCTIGGLEVVSRRRGFAVLRDPGTGQTLLVAAGCPARGVHMELTVADLAAALRELEQAGGMVVEQWELAALCADPEGNPLMLLA